MRLPRMTTRQLMLAVAIVALVLSPGVVGKGPDESRPLDWALAMALANVPPILILPVLFRLDRLRGSLVIAATAGIAAAQVALRAPPNLYAVDGYMAIAAMARLARYSRPHLGNNRSCLRPSRRCGVWLQPLYSDRNRCRAADGHPHQDCIPAKNLQSWATDLPRFS